MYVKRLLWPKFKLQSKFNANFFFILCKIIEKNIYIHLPVILQYAIQTFKDPPGAETNYIDPQGL